MKTWLLSTVAALSGMVAVHAAVPADGTEWDIAANEAETLSGAHAFPRIYINGSLTLAPDAALTLQGGEASGVAAGEGTTGSLVIQSGANLTAIGTDKNNLPGNAFAFAIGAYGGVGTVTVEAGGSLVVEDARLCIGRNGLSPQTYSREMTSRGVLNIFGRVTSRVVETAAWYPSPDGVDLAQLNLEEVPLAAEINLEEGGVLEIGQLQRQDLSRTIVNFRGGTLRALLENQDFVTSKGVMQWRIAEGKNLIFDTQNRHIAVLMSGLRSDFFTISGAGGLVKKGSAYLQFRFPASANSFTGPIVVEEGVLSIGRPLAEGQTVYVHKGAAFYPACSADLAKIAYEDPSEAPGGLYSVESYLYDGLDLADMGPTYDTNRLGGPQWGWGGRVEGPIAYPEDISLENPFELVGRGNTLTFARTGLENCPFLVSGTGGTFRFEGTRTNETDNAIVFAGPVRVEQSGSYTVEGKDGETAHMLLSGAGTLATGEVRIGTDGKNGEMLVTNNATLTANGNIVIGGNKGDRVTTRGKLVVENAVVVASGEIKLAPTTRTDGADLTTLLNELVVGPGSTVRVGNRFTRNDDARSRITFRGGHVSPQRIQDDFFYSGQNGILEVVADAGSDISLNVGTNRVGMISNHTHVFGEGGLDIYGNTPNRPGEFTLGKSGLGDFTVDYKGDTTITDAILHLGYDNVLPTWPEASGVVKGTRGVLALDGVTQVAKRLEGSLTVRGPGCLSLGADNADFVFEQDVEGATISKTGTGTMTLAKRMNGSLSLNAGTVVVSSSNVRYRSYRFVVEAASGTTENSMQLAELVLFAGDQDVTRPYADASWDDTTEAGGTTYPAGEHPGLLVDGKIETKWLDFRAAPNRSAADRARVWLRLDYAEPREITHYCWYTANDSPERDPRAWRLQGSNDDGATWVDLDVQADFAPPADRRVLACTAALGASFGAGSVVSVGQGTTLRVTAGTLPLASLDNYGTVELDEGATLQSRGGVMRGGFTGDGTIEVVSGMTTFVGSDSFPGLTHVTGGSTLNLGVASDATRTFDGKYFRLTITRSNGGSNNGDWHFQASEFQLYNAAGEMQNRGLTAAAVGTPATRLEPGTFSCPRAYVWNTDAASSEDVPSMFDGDTNTKWACSEAVDGKNGIQLVVTMRLADEADAIASYNFITANDYVRRSPSDWTLEGSRDGSIWERLDVRRWAPHTAFSNRGNYSADSIKFKPMNNGTAYRFESAPPTPFSGKYFRFTFKKTSGNTILQLSELGLYDIVDRNVAEGLKMAASGTAAADLAPGTFAKADTYAAGGSGSEDADKLFDGNPDTKLCAIGANQNGDSAQWRILTIRLPESALPIKGYLFTTANDSLERSPCDWLVEGSTDGVNWVTLDERAGEARPYCLYTAMNAGHPYTFNSFALPGAAELAAAVQVDAGSTVNLGTATTSLSGLRIEFAHGGGTINGFRPAAGGVLELVDLPSDIESFDELELPVTVTEASNVGALRSWKVNVEGEDRADLKVKLSADGKLVLVSAAFTLFLR